MTILRKSLFSILLVIFLLGLLEFVAFSQLKANIYDGDTAYFWKLKPNLDQQVDNGSHPFHLQTNDLGFRDEPLDGRDRWLFLGCSTTLGWGVDVEDTFLFEVQQKMPLVDVLNGGQPGWSTAQVLLNIESFQSLNPTHVFVGLGVRDAQMSMKADKEAIPSPWLLQTSTFMWLQQLKNTQSDTSIQTTQHQFRVSPVDYSQALSEIIGAFPESTVVLYEFPQVEFSVEHANVLTEMGALKPAQFPRTAFFPDDVIHLNTTGHQRLADWFMTTVVTSPNL